MRKEVQLEVGGFKEAKPEPKAVGLANSNIKKIVGVVSGKGGVGKSLVTSLLADAANKSGLKTGILDADITGPSIAKIFGVTKKADVTAKGIIPNESKNGIKVMSVNMILENSTDPVLWRGPILGGVVKQFYEEVYWGDIDVLFVDMPPGTGDVPLTVYQSIPIDGIVVVTTPQDLVSMIVTKAVKMADMMNINVYGLVENMAYFLCPDNNKKYEIFGKSKLEEYASNNNLKVLKKMPIDPNFANKCDEERLEEIDVNPMMDVIKEIM